MAKEKAVKAPKEEKPEEKAVEEKASGAVETIEEKKEGTEQVQEEEAIDVVETPVERPKKKKKKGKEKPVWIEYKPKEIEELVVSLSNQGNSPSLIGTILREQNGILDVREATKKTISEILVENNVKQDIPEDLLFLIRKAVALDGHMKKNKKDMSAKHGYELTVSKIRRLVKYYIKKKSLPADWRYTIETASLLVK
jgi:small subunit ribosomal protein S15